MNFVKEGRVEFSYTNLNWIEEREYGFRGVFKGMGGKLFVLVGGVEFIFVFIVFYRWYRFSFLVYFFRESTVLLEFFIFLVIVYFF